MLLMIFILVHPLCRVSSLANQNWLNQNDDHRSILYSLIKLVHSILIYCFDQIVFAKCTRKDATNMHATITSFNIQCDRVSVRDLCGRYVSVWFVEKKFHLEFASKLNQNRMRKTIQFDITNRAARTFSRSIDQITHQLAHHFSFYNFF